MLNFIKSFVLNRVSWLRKLQWIAYNNYYEHKKEEFREFGSNCSLSPGCLISHKNKVTIKNNVLIHGNSVFHTLGGLYIGNNVGIAVGCTIWTADHMYEDGITIPHGPNDLAKPVYIHDNVWIGANVSILPGTEIHEGAIIGMGSVVGKDVPYCGIVIGNLARVIGYRDKEMYEECKKKGKFVDFSARGRIIIPKSIQRRSTLLHYLSRYIDNEEMFLDE